MIWKGGGVDLAFKKAVGLFRNALELGGGYERNYLGLYYAGHLYHLFFLLRDKRLYY